MIDETHDPALRSWVASANRPNCDFPVQNLPVGVFRYGPEARVRLGVAIGEFVLDLAPWLAGDTLNGYFALPASDRRQLRRHWSACLRENSPARKLLPQTECTMLLPAAIGDYTDFYASIHHAINVGKMFRPENPLLPNYRQVPIAYHGRSSSIVVSGTPIKRPCGQLSEGRFGRTNELDYELEIGAFIGAGNALGEPIPIVSAGEHLAGVCLLNDWSARDIQRWEYQPLGPFLAKNFATSISPWVITAEALEPFRTLSPAHDALPLPYLRSSQPGAFDISLEVWLLAANTTEPVRLSRSFFQEMYWTFDQMITHHTSNGCPLRPGDLLGSGTISGPETENYGCLLEMGKHGYLQDGDTVIFHAHCQRENFKRIGFGECLGTIRRH